MASAAAFPSSPTRGIPPIHTPSYPFHQTSSSPSPSPATTYSHSHSNSYSGSAPSTAPSSTFNFPSPTKPVATTPNSHPYAIKTTSTALLSRSNSSSAQASNAVHRYVPPASPSPSPISPSSGTTGLGQEEDEGSSTNSQRPATGSMGLGRRGKHRYSRSLTDAPLPMPVPPGVTNNASNHYTGYSPSPSSSHHVRERARSLVSEPEDEETPKRRPDGSYAHSSSASSMGPPATPLSIAHRHSKSNSGSGSNTKSRTELSLPEDPKNWSAGQVAGYLTAMLREGGGEGVASSLAKFVNESQMTGKVFLRLSEADLDRSETLLSPLARETLLRASRALRQNALRERMFPSRSSFSSNSPFDMTTTSHNSDDEDTAERTQGTPDGVTVRRRARMVQPRTPGRSRNSSMSSTSSVSSSASASGRVRDMVDELERTTSTDNGAGRGTLDEEGTASSRSGTRSVSPVKSGLVHSNGGTNGTSRRADGSPSKYTSGRALPQRPSVNDLFGGPPVVNPILAPNLTGTFSNTSTPNVSDRAVEEKEQDETITRVAKRNVNGREPRLLPFPPPNASMPGAMAGMLTPSHTGANFPLPSSPEQHYQQHQPPGPGDYELGFRHALSPHSQAAFVVRHGPSPSNLAASPHPGGAARPARLLPYPPVSSEAALHHPRPRRAVGVSDRDAEGETGTSEGDEAYGTARESESQDESDSVVESGTTSGDGGDEMSVAELLAAESASTQGRAAPVSGALAWEMELGDTVKRVQGGEAQQKPRAPQQAQARAGGREEKTKSKSKGTGRDNEGLRRPGVMGLFDEVPVVAPGDEPEVESVEEQARGLGEKARKVAGRAMDVDEKEREVVEREREVDVKEREVDEKAMEVEDRSRRVDEEKRHAEEKNSQIEVHDGEVERKIVEVRERKGEVDERAREADERLKEVEETRRELDQKARDVHQQSEEMGQKARYLDQKSQDVDQKSKEVEERSRIEERQASLDIREQALILREQAVSRHENTVEEDVQAKTSARELELELKAKHVDDKDAALHAREEALGQRMRDVASREEEVWKKEESLGERERAMAQAEARLQSAKQDLNLREEKLGARVDEVKSCEECLGAREERLQQREVAVEERERMEAREAAASTSAAAESTARAHEHEQARQAAEEQTRIEQGTSSPGTDILRQCWNTFVLPLVTPAFLRSSSSIPSQDSAAPAVGSGEVETEADVKVQAKDTTEPPPSKSLLSRYLVPTWAVRRDAFIGRFMGPGGLTDGYLVLMGLGMCVAVFRALGRRGWATRP